MLKRLSYQAIWSELAADRKMVFLSGPRQCGKTTLARAIAETYPNRCYRNWDIPADKKLILKEPSFFEKMDRKDGGTPLVVLDEIHKYRHWKNYLKGLFDGFGRDYRFLVLGSGRLDAYQRGGDSLAGRYSRMSLFPFTLSELGNAKLPYGAFRKDPLALNDTPLPPLKEIWDALGRFSGFPEPFVAARDTLFRRWTATYERQLVREDIRNATALQQIDSVESLFLLLPERVGSLLSLESLGRDIQVSGHTIRQWLEIFETFYLSFRIPPWSRKIARAISRERKLYLYNYAVIDSPAVRFENMVALELLRAVTSWNDLGLGNFSFHFLRNKSGEEVDFLIAESNKPFLMIEAKSGDETVPNSLCRFQAQLPVPAVLLVNKPGIRRIIKGNSPPVLVATAWHYLAGLP